MTTYRAKDCYALTDLTRLEQSASREDIEALTRTALEYHMPTVCVLSEHLQFIPTDVALKRATVLNFPSGNEPLPSILSQLEHIARTMQVDEIDYVFAYPNYLQGGKKEALKACHDVSKRCKDHGLLFKVILETGAFPSNLIYPLSLEVIQEGCDFLKTSTGKINQGATLSAVTAMLSAILDSKTPCGIKVSGGIASLEQAFDHMALAERMLHQTLSPSIFRIGTSRVLSALDE